MASFPLDRPLPETARPAIAIVRRLTDAGHTALLAGGCVRDLLLGSRPEDFDVATDAPPAVVRRLFRATRLVGAQFGVVLVRQQGVWVEVATFRTEGAYSDGRHPDEVHFTDARADARRRDFTVNGMFLDPLQGQVLDYVGGRSDLDARQIRAIGDPHARFAEDHLRLLRAVRFAARLDFALAPDTQAAITASAAQLERVASERVREELEKMLGDPRRARAVHLLRETGLLDHLWPGADWCAAHLQAAAAQLARLQDPRFELTAAMLLADRPPGEIDAIARRLTFSNRQREHTIWLVVHQAALDDPARPSLAELKHLLAHPAFPALRQWAEIRHGECPDGAERTRALHRRIAAIPAAAIQPPPLVTGDDLAARHVPRGPIYRRVLAELYERQLNEHITSREAALRELERLLADENERSTAGDL